MSNVPEIVTALIHVILMGFCFWGALAESKQNPVASVCWLVALVLLYLEPVLL